MQTTFVAQVQRVEKTGDGRLQVSCHPVRNEKNEPVDGFMGHTFMVPCTAEAVAFYVIDRQVTYTIE